MNHIDIAQTAFTEGLRCETAANELLRGNQALSAFAMPAFLLHALASELYLKSLLIRERNIGKARGHDLMELFKRLSTSSRDMVNRCYAPTSPDEPQNFLDLLNVDRAPFEAFRYRYELRARIPVLSAGLAPKSRARYEPCGSPVAIPFARSMRYEYEVDGRFSSYSTAIAETLRKAILGVEVEWAKEKIDAECLLGKATWSWLDPATATVRTEMR